jgi:hypothetical protein
MLETFIMRRAEEGLAATAEALFPVNDHGAPDFRTTELVRRMYDYWDELPKPQRRLLVLLFALVELAAPLLVLGFRRFSRLPAPRREAAVRAWRRSRVLPLRLLGDALKASTTLIYMSHPAALAHIGMYSACARPADLLPVAVRRDSLPRMKGGA